jgi:hypothetical protein
MKRLFYLFSEPGSFIIGKVNKVGENYPNTCVAAADFSAHVGKFAISLFTEFTVSRGKR